MHGSTSAPGEMAMEVEQSGRQKAGEVWGGETRLSEHADAVGKLCAHVHSMQHTQAAPVKHRGLL